MARLDVLLRQSFSSARYGKKKVETAERGGLHFHSNIYGKSNVFTRKIAIWPRVTGLFGQ
jgi:hypothetical protein